MQPPQKITLSALVALAVLLLPLTQALAQQHKPNIIMIMGDDIGIWNIGAYHRGMMASQVKVDWPILVNLRLDPFERTGIQGSLFYKDWFVYEFWRFVFVQQELAKAAQTFLAFPPLQKGASFNLEALKEELAQKAAARASQ